MVVFVVVCYGVIESGDDKTKKDAFQQRGGLQRRQKGAHGRFFMTISFSILYHHFLCCLCCVLLDI